MDNEDLKEEFFDYIHKKKYEGQNTHDTPSPETLKMFKEQGDILSSNTTAIEFMQNEITDVKKLVEKIDSKLDTVIEKKADKEEVSLLWGKVEEVKNSNFELRGFKMWLTGAVAIIMVGGGTMAYLFAQNIRNLAKDDTKAIISEEKEHIAQQVVSSLETKYNLKIK